MYNKTRWKIRNVDFKWFQMLRFIAASIHRPKPLHLQYDSWGNTWQWTKIIDTICGHLSWSFKRIGGMGSRETTHEMNGTATWTHKFSDQTVNPRRAEKIRNVDLLQQNQFTYNYAALGSWKGYWVFAIVHALGWYRRGCHTLARITAARSSALLFLSSIMKFEVLYSKMHLVRKVYVNTWTNCHEQPYQKSQQPELIEHFICITRIGTPKYSKPRQRCSPNPAPERKDLYFAICSIICFRGWKNLIFDIVHACSCAGACLMISRNDDCLQNQNLEIRKSSCFYMYFTFSSKMHIDVTWGWFCREVIL